MLTANNVCDWLMRCVLLLALLAAPAAAEDKPAESKPAESKPAAKPAVKPDAKSPANPDAKSPAKPPRLDKDIAYGKDHERQKLDLYRPAADDASDKPARLPVIVWVHGGAWLAGSKANPPGLAFAAKGYAVASINYRLSQHAAYPAQLHDCKAAIRFLRANADKYGLDPDRIGVWGGSAGGHLVALLGTTGDVPELEGTVGDHTTVSSKVACVCDWFGPTDLARIAEGRQGKGPLGTFDTPDHPVYKLFGGTIADKKELVEQANPLKFASSGDAPVLIVHGDRDPLVPLAQSEIFVEALKKANVACELIVIKNGGHGGAGFFAPDIIQKHVEFFDKHLKP